MKSAALAILGFAYTSQAVSVSDFFVTDWTRFGKLWTEPEFYYGFVLGLQELDDDTASLCYTSMKSLETVFTDMAGEGWNLNTIRLLGRHFYWKYIDPIEKIFTKFSLFDMGFQVLMGGSNYPYICVIGFSTTHSLEGSFL